MPHRRAPIVALALSAAACAGMSEPPQTSMPPASTAPSTTMPATMVGRLEDLDYLDRRIRETHPDPFWRSGEGAYLAELDGIRDDAATMTALEFGLAVLRLVALIDGHSRVATDVAPLDFHRFEILMYEFDDGMFVLDSDEPAAIGARVVAVGGVPVDEAWARVEPYVQRDNQMTLLLAAPVFLTYVELLEALGILEGDAPPYTVETIDGSLLELDPPALAAAERANRFDGASFGLAGGVVPAEPPLYLANAGRAFWWTFLDDSATLYVQMNRITGTSSSPEGGERVGLGAMATEIGTFLDQTPVERAVLDLRHNAGGDNTTYGPILELLSTHPRIDREEGLFVIVGRNTFSAAMNLATEIENETGAIFAGEPTGARPNLYGDTVRIRLPNSGIEAHVSAKYWPIAGPGDTREWIEPSIASPLGSADYFAGVDPVLDAVLAWEGGR